MDSMNKNLSQFFNVPVQPDSKPTAIAGGTFNNNNFQKDYELVQGNFKDLLNNGSIALESALKVATGTYERIHHTNV